MLAIMSAEQWAPMDWVAAREITDKLKFFLTKAWDELIIVAYFRRAWAALGYESWDVYCEKEFAGTWLRFPREERINAVYRLREAGLSTRGIAAAIGTSEGTVRNDLAAGAQNYAPGGEPTIKGLDGKQYSRPKTKRKPKPKPPNTFTYKVERTVDLLESNALGLSLLTQDPKFPFHRDEITRRDRDRLLYVREQIDAVLPRLSGDQCDLDIAV